LSQHSLCAQTISSHLLQATVHTSAHKLKNI